MKIEVYVKNDGTVVVRLPKGVLPDRAALEHVAAVIEQYRMPKAA